MLLALNASCAFSRSMSWGVRGVSASPDSSAYFSFSKAAQVEDHKPPAKPMRFPQRKTDQTLLDWYHSIVDAELLSFDDQQYSALQRLQHLSQALSVYHHSPPPPMLNFPSSASLISKHHPARPKLWDAIRSRLSQLTSASIKPDSSPNKVSSINPDPVTPGAIFFGPPNRSPQSIYFHGPVGVGKSLVMDLFFDSVPLSLPRKRRVHFHDFMHEIHTKYIDQWNSVRNPWNTDPLGSVARLIASETTLLCFDELHITDLVSAIFFDRLFDELFYHGVVIVSTSNKAISQLWDSGPLSQRQPIIDRLQRIWTLYGDSFEFLPKDDYRKKKPLNTSAFINISKEPDARHVLMRAFFRTMPCEEAVETQYFASQTRFVTAHALGRTGLAQFGDLCCKPNGASEFKALAVSLDRLFLFDVPKFTDDNLSDARRFILLIDQLYEHRVHLLMTADADLDNLFSFSFLASAGKSPVPSFEEAVDDRTQLSSRIQAHVVSFDSTEAAFMFHRAVSRIYELTSHAL